jgi:hypothetical protein
LSSALKIWSDIANHHHHLELYLISLNKVENFEVKFTLHGSKILQIDYSKAYIFHPCNSTEVAVRFDRIKLEKNEILKFISYTENRNYEGNFESIGNYGEKKEILNPDKVFNFIEFRSGFLGYVVDQQNCEACFSKQLYYSMLLKYDGAQAKKIRLGAFRIQDYERLSLDSLTVIFYSFLLA